VLPPSACPGPSRPIRRDDVRIVTASRHRRNVTAERADCDVPPVTACDEPFAPSHGMVEMGSPSKMAARRRCAKLRALHAAPGRLIDQVPPQAAPCSRPGDGWIKRARTSPPRGASRPRFLRATGPPQGLLPAVTPTPKARWGTRVACVGSCVWFGVGSCVESDVPVEVPESGRVRSSLTVGGAGAAELASAAASAEGASMLTAIRARLEVAGGGNCSGGSCPGDDPPVT
jgi:hypothetical protein